VRQGCAVHLYDTIHAGAADAISGLWFQTHVLRRGLDLERAGRGNCRELPLGDGAGHPLQQYQHQYLSSSSVSHYSTH
ncbi:unnamed protein product, partial [Symbiodinium necroappetens]